MSLGSVGTRRTVYLSEDEPPTTSTPANQSAPPLLVFNRISTVIGEPQRPTSVQTSNNEDTAVRDKEPSTADKKKGDGTKENAIWYEYGCV